MDFPEWAWFLLVTLGALAFAGVVGWSLMHYRAWQDRRRARPTD